MTTKILLHQNDLGFEVLLVPGGMIVYRNWYKGTKQMFAATFVPIDEARATSGLAGKWLDEFEDGSPSYGKQNDPV